MSKENDINILQSKIAQIDQKIANFEKYGISEKKIQDLEMKKLKYQTQLEEIQNS